MIYLENPITCMIWFGGGSESRAWWCICPAALWRSSQTAQARKFATIFMKTIFYVILIIVVQHHNLKDTLQGGHKEMSSIFAEQLLPRI